MYISMFLFEVNTADPPHHISRRTFSLDLIGNMKYLIRLFPMFNFEPTYLPEPLYSYYTSAN